MVSIGHSDAGEFRMLFAGTCGPASVGARDAALDARLRQQLDTSVAAAEAITPPFDHAIRSTEGRAQLGAVVAALRMQAATIVEVARLFGFQIEIAE